MSKMHRSFYKRIATAVLSMVLLFSVFPFMAPSELTHTYAANGELTVPTIHVNSTYSVGQSITFTWNRSSGVSDFLHYDVDITNENYPFLDSTWKLLSDINTNSYTFTPAHSGIYRIRVSAAVDNDNLSRGKDDVAYVKVGNPLSIKNVSISADCCTISGSYSRQCNTTDSITIEPVSGEGRKFYPRSILHDYTDSKTWNELANCNFTYDISSYNVPDGQYKVTIKAAIDQFSTTYTTLITINHKWNAGIITTPAGCVTDGIKTFTCSKCEGTKTETIQAIGDHEWNSGKVTKTSTCSTYGTKTFTCDTCGETKTESIPKNNVHSWDSGKVTKAAKYFSTGVRTYTCTKCKKTRTETIPKLNVAKVTPAKVKLKGATVTNKKLTVKWKRVAKNTTGYQVSLKNKSTGKVKTYTVKQSNKATLSKTIKKLQKKKTYAVRVRAYHKIGTEIIYGKWSKVLSGKI